MVYHRSFISAAYRMKLNEIYTENPDNGMWNSTAPTDSVFTVGSDGSVNASGETYVAYLFAHDTGVDGLIQCGSFTQLYTDVDITLGWEPQFVLTKATDQSYTDWLITDNSRGFTADAKIARLWANSAEAEANSNEAIAPTATGFKIKGTGSGGIIGIGYSGIYMAIRRGPMKKPTVGTQVYNAIARTGTGAEATVTGVGFPPDLAVIKLCNTNNGYSHEMYERLTGSLIWKGSSSSAGEAAATQQLISYNMDGVSLGTSGGTGRANYSGDTYINHFFRRYKKVFDVVCYTGTGGAASITHGLGVVPELIIVKCRSQTGSWYVPIAPSFSTGHLLLESSNARSTFDIWSTKPTASVFTTNASNADTSLSTARYVAYLFATLAEISKVGSYTGNGSSLTINAGFTGGARFVMIKRTDSAGDWYIWGTVRGIIAGNDPHLSMNSNAVEVTTDDSIDPDNSGFIVNQDAATDINVNTATYIYLAFA